MKLIQINDKLSNQIRSIVAREHSRWRDTGVQPLGDVSSYLYQHPNYNRMDQAWEIDQEVALVRGVYDIRGSMTYADMACVASYMIEATPNDFNHVARSVHDGMDPFDPDAIAKENIRLDKEDEEIQKDIPGYHSIHVASPFRSNRTVSEVMASTPRDSWNSGGEHHGCLKDTWSDASYGSNVPETPTDSKSILLILNEYGGITFQEFTDTGSGDGFEDVIARDKDGVYPTDADSSFPMLASISIAGIIGLSIWALNRKP